MACYIYFREAFSCFHYSTADPKVRTYSVWLEFFLKFSCLFLLIIFFIYYFTLVWPYLLCLNFYINLNFSKPIVCFFELLNFFVKYFALDIVVPYLLRINFYINLDFSKPLFVGNYSNKSIHLLALFSSAVDRYEFLSRITYYRFSPSFFLLK